MNPTILTKIAKHMMIGSVSAYLSFASKHNEMIQKFYLYTLAGIIIAILIVLLWEGREHFQPTSENDLMALLNTNTKQSKRTYLLSNGTRIEMVIALIIISICAMVGSL